MQGSLFETIPGVVWLNVRDGNPHARALFDKHYSRYIYADAPSSAMKAPGFKRAGWRLCGVTKKRKLLIFELKD